MKVVKKLDLGRDFDKKLNEFLDTANDCPFDEDDTKVRQVIVTEVRRIAHQAYKLGQENPNV